MEKEGLDFINKLIVVFVIASVILAPFLFWGSFKIISPGHRGVKITLGEIEEKSLPEGFYLKLPIIQTIKELSVQETKLEGKAIAYSSDAQVVQIDFAVTYFPEKSQIHSLYKNVGEDYRETLIPQIIQAHVKEVAGQYVAVNLISHRNEASQAMFESIVKEMKDKLLNAVSFSITNMDFNDAFEHAVEAKVIAIQNAEEAKNKTVRIKEEAAQKVISAKAEAESMRIRSEALSRNKSLVDYEAVQKWDGKLPEMMTGNGALPFINLKRGQND